MKIALFSLWRWVGVVVYKHECLERMDSCTVVFPYLWEPPVKSTFCGYPGAILLIRLYALAVSPSLISHSVLCSPLRRLLCVSLFCRLQCATPQEDRLFDFHDLTVYEEELEE